MLHSGTGTFDALDICEYFGKYKHDCCERLYFNTVDFPPPPVGTKHLPKDDPVWNRLKLYITRQSHDGGSPVIANGTSNVGERKFVCFCHRLYKEYLHKKSSPFRQDYIVDSDKKGRRVNGRSAARRSTTKRAVTKQQICKFKFHVGWDSKGFFLNQIAGTPFHSSHPKVDPSSIPIPTRLIPEDEKNNLAALADSCVGSGVGRNFLHSKLGRYVSRAKVAYIQDSRHASFTGKTLPKDDVEDLLDFFRDSSDISHQVLWDIPVTNNSFLEEQSSIQNDTIIMKESAAQKDNSPRTFNSTPPSQKNNDDNTATQNSTAGSNQKLVSTCFNREVGQEPYYIDHSNDPGMEVLIEETRNIRVSENVAEGDKVFLCVAWASVEEIRLFKCFPEVIYCDATSDTNNTKNHLVTFSGRTSSGRQFVFLRIWIHNQKTATFQWIFRVVLKTFIPNLFYNQVKMCLVDGDPQQRVNLAEALKNYLRNAVHTTCGFHLVNNSWKRHAPSKVSIKKEMQSKFDNFSKYITNWFYSFMRPGYCENKQEYNLSKTMLYAFLRSDEVKSILCTAQNVKQVEDWVRNIVFIKEDQFLYYQRKRIRYYYQMTTSPHEGTNYGMKSHAARVKPSQKMSKSGRALSLQSSLKLGQLNHESSQEFYNKNLWAKSFSSKYLTTKAESIISSTLEKANNYSVARLAIDSWQVFYCKENSSAKEAITQTNLDDANDNDESEVEKKQKWSPIPLFNRARIVKLDSKNCLLCTCCAFEATGLPCHHTAAVIKHHYENWEGFSHHDCGIEWWKIWHQYAYNKDSVGVSSLLAKAKTLQVTGPSFPNPTRDPPEVTEEFAKRKKFDILHRVRNYTPEQLKIILHNTRNIPGMETTYYEGLSQSSAIHNDDDNFSIASSDDSHTGNPLDVFAPVLQSQTEVPTGSVFELLKHDFYELLNVLETHSKEHPEKRKCEEIRKLIQSQTNSMRVELMNSSKKRPAGENGIVNIMSEARSRSVQRTLLSKNC